MADAHSTITGRGEQAVLACSACPHPWAEHDQIAARYCAATNVGHHQRGCICDVPPVVGDGPGTG